MSYGKVIKTLNLEKDKKEIRFITGGGFIKKDHTGYCYFIGCATKKEPEKADVPVFLKLVEKTNRLGVQKLEKEKGFCVDHPYIERVYGLYDVKYESDGSQTPVIYRALSCEYIRGDSIFSRYCDDSVRDNFLLNQVNVSRDENGIKERKDETALFRHFLQILYAVRFYTEQQYHQKRNIAHRDLKPDNILIREEDEDVVIIDFDFATVPGMFTTGHDVFSNYAMPSEVACKVKNKIQLDIHSLGWVLLFCLTGVIYTYDMKRINDTFFSIDEEHIRKHAGKYLDVRYSGLLQIIRKMIAHPLQEQTYNSIDDLIDQYLEYLRKNYADTEEEFRSIRAGTRWLLPQLENDLKRDQYVKNVIAKYYSPMNKKAVVTLFNFCTQYLSFEKPEKRIQNAELCIQNVNGKIYYMLFKDDIETNADRNTFLLKTGDWFKRNNRIIEITID